MGRFNAIAVALAALTVGCAGMYPTPPARPPLDGSTIVHLDRVDDGLYRGGQPSPDELRGLVQRYGIKTVVKLNSTLAIDGGSDVVPDGVKLVHVPLSVVATPTEEEIKRILDEIDAAPKPVYVHCRYGADRTGLVVGLYRVRHGAKVDDAYLDMLLHGFHPYRALWNAWTRAVGWKN